ncbi:hypothetical protein TC41_0046 [Alicyclobacillus acidocaldarius subsp. acidocaldarius Tc-4-1]|uniref:Uncharacterized protein n=1 Tax=Alicyclobacillus acidocaldarius (strain Tc-4-1) TaxID=1048834 RepID=F8IHQ9_ALIAT|nr:hypothetical protein TC41_0046 [Alicyclobacillus acidocaldarius subsp. acidocaldarius Tc-4-1]
MNPLENGSDQRKHLLLSAFPCSEPFDAHSTLVDESPVSICWISTWIRVHVAQRN